jgi:sRNA-binding protein
MARHGGGSADPGDPGQQGFAFWRRRQRAEAEAWEARAATAQAQARLAEAREAQTTAEQEARTAREQAAAARQERDEAVAAAQSRAAEAESRAGEAGQDAALAVGDQLIPHVFAHMIRRFPWGTTVAAAAGYLGTTVGTPASPSAAR